MTQTEEAALDGGTASASPASASPGGPRHGGTPATVRKRRLAQGKASWVLDPKVAYTRESLLERLLGPVQSWRDFTPTLRLWFWLGPILTAVLGGVLRFVRLGAPRSFVFHETY